MNTVIINEQQLQTEINALKTQFPETRDIYREVCVLLFFRYGITPTANKLYQYVRRGSMSAPAEALNKFWIELREKSRVRIERPDIPDNIAAIAGDLISNLWNEAQQAAQAGFSDLVDNASAEILEFKLRSEVAEQEAAEIKNLHKGTISELENLSKRLSEAEKKHEVDIITLADKEKALRSLQNEKSTLKSEIMLIQAKLSAQVDKLHQSLTISDQRYRALESKTLLEVDRERQRAAKLEKQISVLNKTIIKEKLTNNIQLTKHNQLVNSLRENIGLLKGQLKENQKQQKVTIKTLDHKNQKPKK